MPDVTPIVPAACDSAPANGRRGFAQLRRAEFDDWCRAAGLGPQDRAVFAHLLLEADDRTGVVEGFSLTRCSTELGLGRASGRRTLARAVRRLAAAGAIRHRPSTGYLPGRVEVVPYRELVRVRSRRTRGNSDNAARIPRADGRNAA
ncbi:MAG: hypothetical protein ACLGIO_09070, partial [Acidimicrobiia bacterium]